MPLEGGIKYTEPVKRRKQMIVNLLMEHKGGGKCVVKWKSRASEVAEQVEVFADKDSDRRSTSGIHVLERDRRLSQVVI